MSEPAAPMILASLHLADLYRDPRMRLPTMSDWQKIPRALAGTWPVPVPSRPIYSGLGGPDWADVPAILHQAGPTVVIDTEYDRHSRVLSTVGIGWRHTDGTVRGVQLTHWMRWHFFVRQHLSAALRQLCLTRRIVFQNTLADAPVLALNCAIAFPADYAAIEDTMLAHAVLWSEWPHTLEFLASMYGVFPKMKHLADTDPTLYNWGDVLDTLTAWEALERELSRDPASERVYREQSLRLLPELARAKARGIRIHRTRVVSADMDTHAALLDAERLACAWAGWPINLGSNPQLATYLYGDAGLPVQRHKKTKKVTINADAIAELRNQVTPVPDPDMDLTVDGALVRIAAGADPILEARVLYADALQVESHYLRPALVAINEGDGRFYPDQLIHAQATGRWSTNNPPLAQLPAALRDIICPDPGHTWLAWDWDQIELRLNAALSGDAPTLQAFARGEDIHTLNVCALFGYPVPLDRQDPHVGSAAAEWRATHSWDGKDDLRRVFAKRFTYRLDYGGDPARAGDIPGAKALGLASRDLVLASQRYLAEHPQKAQWRLRVAAEARQTGESRTFVGRRRRLLGDRHAIVREAFNHPMQGGVADIFNLTFVAIVDACPWLEWVYGMHDSQHWACPVDRVDETWAIVKPIVEHEWDVFGTHVTFPASYKEIHP